MNERKINPWFPVFVWLSTVILAPLWQLVWFYGPVLNHYGDWFSQFKMFLTLGFVFSMPVFGVCFVVFYLLAWRQLNSLLMKGILLAVSIVGIDVMLHVVDSNPASRISIPYYMILIVSVIGLPIYKRKLPI